jgi:hypothetical protein
MRRGHAEGVVAFACLVLAACVPQSIALSPSYSAAPRHAAHPSQAAACLVHLGGVTDARNDTQAMGDIATIPVLETDSTAWLRSGLESLSDGTRITFVDEGQATVQMSAELLKAYIQSEAGMAEAANVVVRVRYDNAATPIAGSPDAVIYRGRQAGVNWTSGKGETQSALDSSLGQILEKIGLDLAQRCRAKSS